MAQRILGGFGGILQARRVGASLFESRRRFRPPRQIAGLDECAPQLAHDVERPVRPLAKVREIPMREPAEMGYRVDRGSRSRDGGQDLVGNGIPVIRRRPF